MTRVSCSAVLSLETIQAHPANQPLLAFFQATGDVPYFRPGEEVSPFDEGGQIFFALARNLPDDAKVILGIRNLLVHPTTGRIFAFHQGRLTIVIRFDPKELDGEDPDELRVGDTMDGSVDFRWLGPGWALIEALGEDSETVEAAFQLILAEEAQLPSPV